MVTHIDREAAERLLTPERCMTAIREGYRIYGLERSVGSVPRMSVMIGRPPEGSTMFPLKGAVSSSLGMAAVLFGAHAGRFTMAVMDLRTGDLLGLVDMTDVVRRRAALSAIVAFEYVAGSRSGRVVTLIGTGKIGSELGRGLARNADIAEMRVVSRRLEHADALAAELAQLSASVRTYPLSEIDVACDGADVVFASTSAHEPFLFKGTVPGGSVVVVLGGGHEIDASVLDEVDALIVDDLEYASIRGSMARWLEAGDVSRPELEKRLDADIGQLAIGERQIETSEEGITLAIIQGMEICDLVIARDLLAESRGAVATRRGSESMTENQTEDVDHIHFMELQRRLGRGE